MKIRKSVKNAMSMLNIKKLRPYQLKPINRILDGKDTMVIAPTSFGKSLLYIIPAVIHNQNLTIVIEPLLALMHDQVAKLRELNVHAAYLDSTQSKSERETVMDALKFGRVNILYIAPERLETDILTWLEKYNRIQMIVVDECHCVTTWGYAFREAYLAIGEYVSKLKNHPTIVALTATAVPEDRPRIMELLGMDVSSKCFEMDLYRSNLIFLKKSVPSRNAQKKALKSVLKKYHHNTTVIYCATRLATESAADFLKTIYPGDVVAYHSSNKKSMKHILSGDKHIVVATSALGMGVDIRDVDLVIHFNMPMSLAEYYQMAGRGGRDGQLARSILLYNSDDYRTNYAMLQDIQNPEARRIALDRLDEMKEFCDDNKHCMVQTILTALGDSHKKACRYCTNCQKGR